MMGTQTIRITDEAVAILDSYGTKALEARESRNPRTKAKKAIIHEPGVCHGEGGPGPAGGS